MVIKPRWLTLAVLIIIAGWWFLRTPSASESATRAPSSELTPTTANQSPLKPKAEASPGGAVGVTPEPFVADDAKRIAVFREILAGKNDNDPRLDRDLKNLSPTLKSQLRAEYQALPKERLNGRGTTVFLIGREVKSADDVKFLNEVLTEPLCRSVADCAHAPAAGSHEQEHAAMVDETTLVYPQLVAVHSLATVVKSGGPEPLRSSAIEALERAARSENPRLARAAAAALHSQKANL